MNKGSIWRKVDLHIHTPLSIIQNYGGDTEDNWEKFIKDLENENNYPKGSIIGINDYYFIDGYEKVINYKKQGRLRNIDLILPVIELRLDIIVSTGDNINYHILFSNNIDLNKIKKFIKELGFCNNNMKKDLTKTNLETLGDNNLEESFNRLIIKNKLLLDKIESNEYYDFKEKILMFLGYNEYEHYNEKMGGFLDKLDFGNQVDFLCSGGNIEQVNRHIDKYKNKALNKGIIDKCFNYKILQGSDAHNFTDYKDEKYRILGKNNNTWINCTHTFESLRQQILYEYDDNVKITEIKPDKKNEEYLIDNIKIINKDNNNEEIIYFNQNLNSIIGEKGSGKSFLLYIIAKTILKQKYFEENFDGSEKNDKNEKKFSEKYKEVIKNFNIEIKYLDGESLKYDDNIDGNNKSILYIPQGYLIKKSAEQDKKIKDIIKEKLDNNIDELKNENSVFKKNIQENEQKILDEISKYKNF